VAEKSYRYKSLRQKEIKITGALTFGNQWFYFLEIAMSGKSVLVFNGALPFLFIIAPDKTVFLLLFQKTGEPPG